MPPRESTKERAPGWGRGREVQHDGTAGSLLFLSLGRSEGMIALPKVTHPGARASGKGRTAWWGRITKGDPVGRGWGERRGWDHKRARRGLCSDSTHRWEGEGCLAVSSRAC